MKLINLFVFYSLCIACSTSEKDKFIRKEITYKDSSIQWYYYSLISNNSPDFIEIKNDKKNTIIIEAIDVITGVKLNDDTLKIELYKPDRGIIYTKQLIYHIEDLYIKYDTTNNYKSYSSVPIGVKAK